MWRPSSTRPTASRGHPSWRCRPRWPRSASRREAAKGILIFAGEAPDPGASFTPDEIDQAKACARRIMQRIARRHHWPMSEIAAISNAQLLVERAQEDGEATVNGV